MIKKTKTGLNYFDKLIDKLEEKTNVPQPEPGTMLDNKPDLSDINFKEAYERYKQFSVKDRLKIARSLFFYDTEFRELLINDQEEQKALAKFRNIKIEGLNE